MNRALPRNRQRYRPSGWDSVSADMSMYQQEATVIRCCTGVKHARSTLLHALQTLLSGFLSKLLRNLIHFIYSSHEHSSVAKMLKYADEVEETAYNRAAQDPNEPLTQLCLATPSIA